MKRAFGLAALALVATLLLPVTASADSLDASSNGVLGDSVALNTMLVFFAAVLVLFIGTPIAVFIARACVRNVEQRRPEDGGTGAGLIALCGPVAFVVAFLFVGLFPSDARPFAFGIVWLAGTVLVFPLAVTAGMRAVSRRSDRYPAEVHPPR